MRRSHPAHYDQPFTIILPLPSRPRLELTLIKPQGAAQPTYRQRVLRNQAIDRPDRTEVEDIASVLYGQERLLDLRDLPRLCTLIEDIGRRDIPIDRAQRTLVAWLGTRKKFPGSSSHD